VQPGPADPPHLTMQPQQCKPYATLPGGVPSIHPITHPILPNCRYEAFAAVQDPSIAVFRDAKTELECSRTRSSSLFTPSRDLAIPEPPDPPQLLP